MRFFVSLLLLGVLSTSYAKPIEWTATLLFLKPTIDETYYVISSSNNVFDGSTFPDGKRHQNSTCFTPGFRLEGRCNPCYDLKFTYLSADSRDSVSGDFLFDTNGYPGFNAQENGIYSGRARSKVSYDFYSGDLTYRRPFGEFALIAGLHYAYIKFDERTSSVGTFNITSPLSNRLHRDSRFSGTGPQIGLNYEYLLCRPWAFCATARGMLLCGCTTSDLRYITLTTGPTGVSTKNGDMWRVIPAAAADLGISYTFNCATVEFGYEFGWYSRCIDKVTGLDVAFAGDTLDNFNDFSLQGPYISITSTF